MNYYWGWQACRNFYLRLSELTLQVSKVTNVNFLRTVLIHNQEDRLHELTT